MSEKTRTRRWLTARIGSAILQAAALYLMPTGGKKRVASRVRLLFALQGLWPVLWTLWLIHRGGKPGAQR